MLTGFISEYEEVFRGEPWYGASILDSLSSIPLEQLNFKPHAAGHSIAGLVKHMLAWRKFVVEKLKGNPDYNIDLNTPADWDEQVLIHSMREWERLVEDLKASQQEIVDMLQAKQEEWWTSQVPGKDYSYQHMLRGILQHDIYHLGQIRLTWKWAEQAATKSH